MVISLGIAAAVGAWTQPRQAQEIWNVFGVAADHVSEVIEDLHESAQSALNPHTHVVEPGETLRALANAYDVSLETIAWSNRLIDPDLIMPGQRLMIPPSNSVIHPVRDGDTVTSIAQRYEVDPSELARANQLIHTDSNTPLEMALVVVPNPKLPNVSEIGAPEGKMAMAVKNALVYEVQQGDTLLSLANQFGVTVPTLLRANGITNPDTLSIGTKLRVMPASGVEHQVRTGESLADLAAWYEVDLGPIIDFNGLANPDRVRVGSTLFIPGAAKAPKPLITFVPAPAAPVVRSAPSEPVARTAPASQATAGRAASAPQAQAPATTARAPQASAPASSGVARAPAPASNNTVQAASISSVRPISGGTAGVSSIAMQYLGRPYVWGGTGPSGFDCSGFVWYVYKQAGKDVSRGLWGQMNAGPRVSRDQLQPGDAVFFANTYMPGLSHAGIYIGGGRFIHASDERTGVTISSIGDSYWGPRFIGATRI